MVETVGEGMMAQTITEARVTELWERVARGGRVLMTTEGEALRVVYAGRPGDAGGDYREAVLDIGGRQVKGSIELHVRARGWQAHRHDRDGAYNGVVLHVVLRDDAVMPTCLENGVPVPVLALEPYLGLTVGESASQCACACSGSRDLDHVTAALDAAGDARFNERSASFGRVLQQEDAAQCLYRGIMGALGYAHNKEAFLTLAGWLPLAVLVEEGGSPMPSRGAVAFTARLLGTAGFLPSQRPDAPAPCLDAPYVRELERVWRACGWVQEMSLKNWRLFRVRPGNHPVRRLAGLACLLDLYGGAGILPGLTTLVESAPPERGVEMLEAGLMAPAEAYWAAHFDFGRECKGLGPHLIGKGRAAEVAVNVVLPFFCALGEPGVVEWARALHAAYPPLEENAIERHMRAQLGIEKRLVSTARRQQGLHHLYRSYCTEGRCGECQLRNNQ